MTKKTPTWSPEVSAYQDRLEELESAMLAVDRASAAADAAAYDTGQGGRALALLIDGDEDLHTKHYVRLRRERARRNGTTIPKRPRGPRRDPAPSEPTE